MKGKSNEKAVNTYKNRNNYHEVEDIDIDKRLNFSFKFLFIITMTLNLIILFYSKDICHDVSYAKCSVFYYIYKSQSFLIIMWIENVIAIVLGLYNIFLDLRKKEF